LGGGIARDEQRTDKRIGPGDDESKNGKRLDKRCGKPAGDPSQKKKRPDTNALYGMPDRRKRERRTHKGNNRHVKRNVGRSLSVRGKGQTTPRSSFMKVKGGKESKTQNFNDRARMKKKDSGNKRQKDANSRRGKNWLGQSICPLVDARDEGGLGAKARFLK